MKNSIRRIIFPFLFLASAHINAQGFPDLFPSRLWLNNRVFQPGHPINLSYKTFNTGTSNATYSYTGFYLSADQLKDASDLFLGCDNETLIRPGDSLSGWNSFYIPNSVSQGNYYLLVVSDINNNVQEQSETNNTIAVPVVIGPVQADVELFNITSPAVMVAGETKAMPFKIINHGLSSVSAGYECVLSVDTILSQNDYLLTTPSYNYFLQQNDPQQISTSIKIPEEIATGNYYILYVADYDNAIDETNEVNNVKHYPVNIVPENVDLSIASLNISPAVIERGLDCNISFDVVNLGSTDAAAGYTDIYFYISKDTIYDAADIGFYYPYSSNATSIGLNDSASVHVNVTKNIATGFKPGNYYMLVMEDQYNVIPETNNRNNCAYFPITIVPENTGAADYDAEILSGSISGTPLVAGRMATITSSVYYWAHSPGRPVYVQFMLSSDPVPDNADIYLSAEYVQFANSDTGHISSGIRLPEIALGGQYYLICTITNISNDPNLSNNQFIQPVTVQPANFDFRMTAVEISSSMASPGNQLDVRAEAFNNGAGHVWYLGAAYYFSSDTVLDNNDILLNTSNASFGDSDSVMFVAYVNIPSTAGYGLKYILCKADNNNSIQETNENNNTCYFPLNIVTPDIDLAFFHPVPASNTGNIYNPSYIQWDEHILNDGNTPTSGGFVSYYLSYDSVLDNSDKYFFSRSLGMISPHDIIHLTNYYNTGNFNSPNGNFYLISKLDLYNNLPETNENNNVTWNFFQLPPPPSVDLSLSQPVLGRSEGSLNSAVRINCRLFNNGVSLTGPVIAKYYLSTDSIYSLNDVQLRDVNVYDIYPSDYTMLTLDLTFPYNTAAGNYYIIVVADPSNTVVETNENNNIKAVPYSIITPSLDFSISQGQVVPANMVAGRSVSTSYNIYKTGYMNVYSYPQVTLLLSADTIFSSNDIEIGSVTSYSGSLILPDSIADGNYYALLYVDKGNYYQETNENNNITWFPVTVEHKPVDIDLVIGYAANTASAIAGEAILFVSSVDNIGTTPVYNPIETGYFLSTDTVWGEADIFLNRFSPQYSFTTYLQLPNMIPPGNYYIIYFADYRSVYGETNEFNNTYAVPITINPSNVDLSLLMPSSFPAVFKTNSQQQVNITARNTGANKSPGFTTSIYLSADTLYGYTDVFIGSAYAATLGSNDSVKLNASIYLADNITPGQYYIIAIVDQSDYYGTPNNVVLETNENNNTIIIPVTIQRADVDLAFKDLHAPVQTAISGASLPFEYRVVNYGNDQSRQANVGIFLSYDTILSPADQSISGGYLSQVSLMGNSEALYTTYLNFWVSSSGMYYILTQVDNDHSCTESNESNNIAWYPLMVMDPGEDSSLTNVDLEVLSPTATSTVAVGSSMVLNSTIHNLGSSTANGADLEYYLSTDAIYSSDDRSLFSIYINQVQGGTSVSKTSQVYIPLSTSPGNYYVIFKANSRSAYDRNPNNNIRAVPVQLTPYGPQVTDLVMHAQLNNTGVIYPGSLRNLTSSLLNIQGNAAHYELNYCLSKDVHYDGIYRDQLLTQTRFDNIPGHDSVIINPSLQFPMTVTPGNYYILAVIQCDYNLTDVDSSNNIVIIPVTVSPANNDLSIPYVMVPGDTIRGVTPVTTNVFNDGLSKSYPANMAYYLSVDDELSSDDVYLENTVLGSISSADDTIIPQVVSLPSYVSYGDYYLLNYADYLSQVTETNEYNNINAIPVNVGPVGIRPVYKAENSMLVFPNPNSGKFTLLLNNNISGELQVLNELGVIIQRKRIKNQNGNLDFNLVNVPPGVYFLKLLSEDNICMTKLVIQ